MTNPKNLSVKRPISGGLRIKKSYCCNAPITHTKGGLILEICSKCKKIHTDRVYKKD